MSRDLRGDGRASRGSSVSGLSGAASSCGGSTAGASEPLINLDELSDEQILTLVNETAIAVEKLHMETVMFEKFYEKLGGGETVTTSRERTESGASSTPESSQPATASGSLLDVGPGAGPGSGRRKSTVSSGMGRRKSSASRMDPRGRAIRLNGKQKCAIATKEVVFAQSEFSKVKLSNRVELEKAKASTEEREMRLADIKKTLDDFNKEIVIGAVHPRTGVYMAEKVIRWMEDNCKIKAHQVEKIRVSIGSIRSKIRKLTLAAQQMAEKGEDDADQDPDQLLLQKQNFLLQLQDKDDQLVLNKKKLVRAQRKKYATQQDLKKELKREKDLEVAIADKESAIVDMEDKIKAIQKSNEKLKIANEKLREKIATHEVPSIDEYIELKLQLEQEQKKTKIFERKLNIKRLIEKNQMIKVVKRPPIFSQSAPLVM